MNRILAICLIITFTAACSNKKKLPEIITCPLNIYGEEIPPANDVLFNLDKTDDFSEDFKQLISFRQLYVENSKEFDLNKFRFEWKEFKTGIQTETLSAEKLYNWIQITGFLFQLTGEVIYMDELEKLSYVFENNTLCDSVLSTYTFTKNTDRVHVNLFKLSEVGFEHSLGGVAGITQQTDFPAAGKVNLFFSMEKKRFLEVFIRIPEWAEDAVVTVKGVKYLANPGTYCRIAKNWKDGDMIDIEFPKGKMPYYLNKN